MRGTARTPRATPGGERQRVHVDALVVAVEAAGHGLGGERAGEEAEAVGDGALLAEVGRVGEAHDHARHEPRARIVAVHHAGQHVPQRGAGRGGGGGLGEELLDLHVLHEVVAHRLVEVAPHLVLAVAGHGADVDLHVHHVRDHVGLHPAPADVRRERGVGGRPRVLGEARREALDRVVDTRGVRQGGLHPGSQVEVGHEVAPEVVDVGRRPVVGEPAHHLRGLHERVVGVVGHGAVARRALHLETPPRHALLPHVHRDVETAVRALAHGAAVFGEAVVGPERVPVLGADVARAEGAARLLVRAGEVDEGAARLPAATGQGLERDRLGGGDVEHVERAAAPHLAVHELAAEGIAGPVLGRDRHHVGVAHQAQGRRLRVAPLDARHQARPAGSGHRLVDLEIEAAAREVGAQEVAGADLLSGGHGAVVDALVADHLLQELHGLAGRDVAHGSVS